MADVLFPQRQRCKTCQKALGGRGREQSPVLLGMYCSARCAGMAEPARTPDRAPRECRTRRDGSWQFKRRYRSESEIPDVIRADPSTSWYTCSHCGHLHIGHSRMGEAEQLRKLMVRDDLGDVMVKLRGKATRKQVAVAAGVRPIRLKEIEEGAERIDLAALMATLSVLGGHLAVTIPQR